MLNRYFPPDFDPTKLPKMKKVGAEWRHAGGPPPGSPRIRRRRWPPLFHPRPSAPHPPPSADAPRTSPPAPAPAHPRPQPPQVRSEDKQMKVRMMLPMTVRCNVCGTFMYKGTKFNTRMEDVRGENYLGIKIFRWG